MHLCTDVDLTGYAASKAATDHLVGMLIIISGHACYNTSINTFNPVISALAISHFDINHMISYIHCQSYHQRGVRC